MEAVKQGSAAVGLKVGHVLYRLPIELMIAQNHLTSLLVMTYSTSAVRHPAEQNSCCFGHVETFTRGVVLTPPQNVQD